MVAGDFRIHVVRITRPSQLVGAVFTGMEFTHDVCRARKIAAVVVLAEGREQDDEENGKQKKPNTAISGIRCPTTSAKIFNTFRQFHTGSPLYVY